MENKKLKNHPIVCSKAELLFLRCKKHPKHRQSPGVCSVCLRERLSQLSSSTSRSNTTTSASYCSSSSSLSSLSYSSSESSPVHHLVLTRSRSVAYYVPHRREGEGREGKKECGFWSKLLRPGRKKIDGGFVHSRTMREKVISTTTRVH